MAEKAYPYKVSVSIITYNQAEYIERAIEGALKQQVDFPYEIIIGDDCSTDGTREILGEYKERYPDLIKLHLHDEHFQGIAGRLNNITNIRSAQGQYIAFCDGDDYWISEDKLQKQVNFMDAHPDYAFCFHDAWYVYKGIHEKKFSEQFFQLGKSRTFTIYDIARKKIQIPFGSVCMRKKYIENLPDWFRKIYRADHALQLIAAQCGNVKYMKNLLSAYSVHEHGMSQFFSKESTALQIYRNDIAIFRKHINIAPDNFLDAKAEYFIELASKAFRNKKRMKALNYIIKSLGVDYHSVNYLGSLLYAKVRRFFSEAYH